MESGRSAQNPVWLYLKESDTLHLMHTSQKGRDQGTSRVMQLTSLDGGRTWSKPKTIIEHSGTFLRNHPIQALDGSWLLPVYHTPKGLFDHKSQYSEVQRSTDEGKSWEPLAMMAPPPMALVQPSIVRLANNFLLSFFRDRRDGNIWRTLSKDDGRSWSHPSRTILPNPNKAVQAMMLQSGAIAILFDNQRGAKQPDHRKLSPMTIALSYDAGTTFPYAKDLEDDYDVLLEYAYPSMVQEPKGDIHLRYDSLQDVLHLSEGVEFQGQPNSLDDGWRPERVVAGDRGRIRTLMFRTARPSLAVTDTESTCCYCVCVCGNRLLQLHIQFWGQDPDRHPLYSHH